MRTVQETPQSRAASSSLPHSLAPGPVVALLWEALSLTASSVICHKPFCRRKSASTPSHPTGHRAWLLSFPLAQSQSPYWHLTLSDKVPTHRSRSKEQSNALFLTHQQKLCEFCSSDSQTLEFKSVGGWRDGSAHKKLAPQNIDPSSTSKTHRKRTHFCKFTSNFHTGIMPHVHHTHIHFTHIIYTVRK